MYDYAQLYDPMHLIWCDGTTITISAAATTRGGRKTEGAVCTINNRNLIDSLGIWRHLITVQASLPTTFPACLAHPPPAACCLPPAACRHVLDLLCLSSCGLLSPRGIQINQAEAEAWKAQSQWTKLVIPYNEGVEWLTALSACKPFRSAYKFHCKVFLLRYISFSFELFPTVHIAHTPRCAGFKLELGWLGLRLLIKSLWGHPGELNL